MTTAKIRALADRFASGFPDALSGPRTIGREAEYPVVRADGTAADVTALWPALLAPGDLTAKREGDLIVQLDGPRYAYALEVGRGTIEVITEPAPDLHALAAAHEEAVGRVVRAAEASGWHVLGYAMQPATPASAELMSAKRRYHVLHDALGDGWLWFALTASDQVQVDITRDELIGVTNLANLLAPVTVALCANSSVHSGADQGVASAREQGMGTLHAGDGRHGMPLGPASDVEDLVAGYARQPFIMRRDGDALVAGDGTFLDWLADADDAWDAFLLHEHYIWNSGRPRSAHGTLELRAACQQPWQDHMAATALGLAMVEAAPALSAFVGETFGADAWTPLRAFHARVVTDGLSADEPAPGFLAGVLDRCRDGLAARGRGEEVFLAPLFDRLARRENPAAEARRLFADGGVAALVEARRIR